MLSHVGQVEISIFDDKHGNVLQFNQKGEQQLNTNVTLLSKISDPIKIKCKEAYYRENNTNPFFTVKTFYEKLIKPLFFRQRGH